MLVWLALESSIPVESWASQPAEAVITAVELIEERNRKANNRGDR